jgi:hypothetical protein
MNTDTVNELINYTVLFLVAFVSGLVITFFSYQKSIGSFGFCEHLSPFVRSFAYYGPEGFQFPLTKSILYSSLSISLFVVMISIISRIIIWLINNYYYEKKN